MDLVGAAPPPAVSVHMVAGTLALVVAMTHVGLYVSGVSKRRPVGQVALLIVGYGLLLGYVVVASPAWRSLPMQFMVLVMVAFLDWFSFYEDKSRFSEESKCITGPCRRNAEITGHLAHWADVGTLVLFGWSNVGAIVGDDDAAEHRHIKARALMCAAALAYGAAGSLLIHRITKPGSVSDLRGLHDEAAKCRRARIMPDAWRGALNELITVLGLLAMWQAVLSSAAPPPTAPAGKLASVLARPFAEAWKNVTEQSRESNDWRRTRIATTAGLLLLPTVTNFVNTAAQHGQLPADLYGIPRCFDDPDDHAPASAS